jgi:uncharacterized protein
VTSVVTSAEEGIERLRAALDRYAGVVVAFSGGVDSGLLAVVASQQLAGRALVATAVSQREIKKKQNN